MRAPFLANRIRCSLSEEAEDLQDSIGKRQYTESIIPGGDDNNLEQSSASWSRCGRCLENRRCKWRERKQERHMYWRWWVRGTWRPILLVPGLWPEAFTSFFFLSKARASIHSENSRLQSSAAASNSLELLPMAPAAQVRDGPCLFLLTPDRNSEGLDVNRIACDFWRIRGREIIETGSTPGQWIS
ncbi:hypothetical protein PVAP13_1NG021236 [Panicum virgatum]|uniref:Uncharacterized protein n=1 Tax=Panicum virgatum TaxID=38727 RepID=A0A8T0WN63_PANVG|nr:hypothetical protein PVAP13_1NG021236 [Panicum virgatum]